MLCDERGLQRGRMNKARLIQVLRDYDANNNDGDRESEAASDAEDSVVETGGDANVAADDSSDVVQAVASTAGDENESDTITVIRFKLALAAEERAARAQEWEREQQRGAMQPPAMHSPRSHFDDVRDCCLACVIPMLCPFSCHMMVLCN